METKKHAIIPNSDEDGEESQYILKKEANCTSTSSVSINSLSYQNIVKSDHDLADDDIPQDVLNEAREAESRMIPLKSRDKYEQQYEKFISYLNSKKIKVVNETVLMGYFNMLSKVRVPRSLWTIHSMLKGTLLMHHSIDISKFTKVTKFLSANQKTSKHQEKKADTFTTDEIAKFLFEAPDRTWLVAKVALIVGLHGACRICELHNLRIENVEDHNTCLKFNLLKTKTGGNRSFTVTGEYCKIIKRYMALRPPNVNKQNFFVKYVNGKCVRQVIGIHKVAEIPTTIASYLNLPNPEKFTGRAFRRTSATIAANGGLHFINLKKLDGWASSAVAEGYIDNCLAQENKVSILISNAIEGSAPSSSTDIRKTPLLVSTSSTTVYPRPSPSSGQVQPPAPKTMKMNAEFHSPTHDDEVLKENPMNTRLEAPLDTSHNIHFHFHNCSELNFYGFPGKEN